MSDVPEKWRRLAEAELPDALVKALVWELYAEDWVPYSASIRDHPDLDELQQADLETARLNYESIRRALARALEVYGNTKEAPMDDDGLLRDDGVPLATTERVRRKFMTVLGEEAGFIESEAWGRDFDRWLARHDADVAANERRRLFDKAKGFEIRLPWGPAGAEMVDRTKVLRLLTNG